MSNLGKGASGTVLQGNGTGSSPKYSTATYPGTAGTSGTILRSNGTNIVNSTATYPATAGTSGTILRSDGTNIVNSTATYPSTATTTGQLLRADGTNWVGTTATYPTTAGTSGNQLTSDGTNWSSQENTGNAYSVNCQGLTPADSTQYFLEQSTTSLLTSSSMRTRRYIARSGTLTKVYGGFSCGGVGTSESVTIGIRLNNTTDINVSTSVNMSASPGTFSNTGLSTAVVAGDFIDFTMTTPAWVTNPTNVIINMTAIIQ